RVIRKYGGTEEFQVWLESGKLPGLYPPLPAGPLPWKRLALPAGLVVFAAALACGLFLGLGKKAGPQRSGMEDTVLLREEASGAVETGGSYRYVLTVDQVLSYYNEARALFNSYRDEGAKRNLNRILESNASRAVKNKARLLKSHTVTPGFDTLKDRFSYAEVLAEPLLYRDCHVLWRGSAANVQSGEDSIRFDFLVGYDTRKVMEGAVPVKLDFPARIDTALPLEVLGRVVPLEGGSFVLEGRAVHQAP
ncbi:MAG: tetratricopeptide repeat protein, partial [Treponema sp.]|nr:tetratricopeptide repeat protein [Treponema sp.]